MNDPDFRVWFGSLMAAGGTIDEVVDAVDTLDPEDRAAFLERLGASSE